MSAWANKKQTGAMYYLSRLVSIAITRCVKICVLHSEVESAVLFGNENLPFLKCLTWTFFLKGANLVVVVVVVVVVDSVVVFMIAFVSSAGF